MKRTYLLIFLLLIINPYDFAQEYKNSKTLINKHIIDLLSKMTLEEKEGHLRSLFAAIPKVNDELFYSAFKMDSVFGKGAIGNCKMIK